MARWKELGEVPDSDDDEYGLDSQDSEAYDRILTSPTSRVTAKPANATSSDIWDIPDSSPPQTNRPRIEICLHRGDITPFSPNAECEPQPISTSSPLSPPPVDRLENDQPVDNRAKANSWVASFSIIDDISTSYVNASVDLPIIDNHHEAEDTVPLEPGRLTATPEAYSINTRSPGSDCRLARQTAVRYERSLRPRKPIQEHPYLLENARYTTVLRKHGVKPVRLGFAVDESRKRQEEEDSQEQNYEEPSQEVRRDEDLDGPEARHSARIIEEPLDGPDLLRFPSSFESDSSSQHSLPKHAGGPSGHPSPADKTDNTSIADEDEDLPSLTELLSKSNPSVTKRRSTYASSPKRKRLRTRLTNNTEPAAKEGDSTNSSSPSLYIPPRFRMPGDRFTNASCDDSAQPDQALRSASQFVDTSPAARSQLIIDLTAEKGLQSEVAEQRPSMEISSGGDSDSGSEVVRSVARRIKGVLPASWIRLDQKSVPGKSKSNGRQRADVLDDAAHRRGVAQPRQNQNATRTPMPVFVDSGSESASSDNEASEAVYYTQSRLLLHRIEDQSDGDPMEDNGVEPMLANQNLSSAHAADSGPGRPHQTNNKKSAFSKMRQPKITTALKRPRPTIQPPKTQYKKFRKAASPKSSRSRLVEPGSGILLEPPKLSILDMVTQRPRDAPNFVRIAARAAKRRVGLGKSSPSKKMIRLATRQDNIDALSVLQDWKRGKISPKIQQRKPKSTVTETRPILGQISGNRVGASADAAPQADSANAEEESMPYQTHGGDKARQPVFMRIVSASRPTVDARPAQLETEHAQKQTKADFNRQKRVLDTLFRRSRKAPLAPSTTLENDLFDGSDHPVAAPAAPVAEHQARAVPLRPSPRPRTRKRKPIVPVQIDLMEPQFHHADDPLPSDFALKPKPAGQAHAQSTKLQGLGPFGTHYTQTFDIFPLRDGVFFHESTILGSGFMERVSSPQYAESVQHSRPRICFFLDQQSLRWDVWDDQVSSEFGILLDWIAEQMQLSDELQDPTAGSTIVEAARFLVEFVQNSINFVDDVGCAAYISRLLAALSGFQMRLSAIENNQNSIWTDERAKPLVEVYVALLCILFSAVQISRQNAALHNEVYAMEQLLQKVSSHCIRFLLNRGTRKLQSLYDELQRQHVRDRGIRDDNYLAHAWAVVIRVLETCQIPRGTFWDVTYSQMSPSQVSSCVDAWFLEEQWQTIFTLLPLTEFDNSGVIVSGLRHVVSVDGWKLPQNILKRVFQLYNENPRQSSGFNDYCRALVGRCLYLVQQWGWRRCHGVIGVIFDFFGSHGLESLRNEEVYKSPRFLELLSSTPPLLLENEDRCFHIFLKLLSLSLQRLGEAGMVKDAQNMVTRTMPNHNRQYLKEQTIYQHDLAALRNHHDLLSTLYWAAPPEARPLPQTIEELVVPADSHKEACLINLRACSQLSRYVASSEESPQALGPFLAWQNRVFRQMLAQFDSAAADVQLQFLAMSKETSRSISAEFMDSVVRANRANLSEVLRFSAKLSLDVLRVAGSLEMATLALNDAQISIIFKRFQHFPSGMDWSILHAGLCTLDKFLDRLDQYQTETSQNDSFQTSNMSPADDAIMLLHDKVASHFFPMARCTISYAMYSGTISVASGEQQACAELAMQVGGKLASGFIRSGLIGSSQLFTRGDFGLFDKPIVQLSPGQRTYLCLFVSILLEQQVTDLTGIGASLFQVWMTSIVKPRQYLLFEIRLGQRLRQRGCEYLPEIINDLSSHSDYATNCDLFQAALSWMRKSLPDNNVGLQKQLVQEHAEVLQKVMQQMKLDLSTLSTNEAEHLPYVMFVRGIISLIRSHASEICPVDKFFYETSKDYSPPLQDPRLYVAGMESYGLRLAEGDTTVDQPLFYYLYNNFKLGLANDRLGVETNMLQQGMKKPGVLSFIIGTMLPSIIRATLITNDALVLLVTYRVAFCRILTSSVMPFQIPLECFPAMVTLQTAVNTALTTITAQRVLSNDFLGILCELVSLVDALKAAHDFAAFSQHPPTMLDQWNNELQLFSRFTKTAERWLDRHASEGDAPNTVAMQPMEDDNQSGNPPRKIVDFADHIVNDVARNWILTAEKISVQAPARVNVVGCSGTTNGSRRPLFTRDEVLDKLSWQLAGWNDWWSGGDSNRYDAVGDMML